MNSDLPPDEQAFANPFAGAYYDSAFLRQCDFASVGDNVRISASCRIIGLGKISIGSNVRIDDFTTIIATGGTIRIGSYVHIAGSCLLSAVDDLVLEDFSGLSNGVRIFTASDDYTGGALTNPTVPAAYTNVRRGPIRIGRHVIVGAGSVILPGADIGDGSAVGALSMVTRSLEPWGVYSGIPVKRLKARKQDLLDAERRLLAG